MQKELAFFSGVAFEAALLVVAVIWGLVFAQPVFQKLDWSLGAAGMGLAATVPLLMFFIWSLHSSLGVFRRHRDLVDSVFRRLFGTWSVWQLAVISASAGICEEVLFRGAFQAGLSQHVGTAAALILVALLFGALHLLSWTYGIIAALMGAYFGWLFVFTDNLFVPVLAHGLYDFLALVYLLRIRREAGPHC